MTAPSFGLCEAWSPIWCCDLPAGSAAITGSMLTAATEVLWGLSGQQFGLCEVTIRPCRRSCFGDWPFMDRWWQFGIWPRPMLYQGAWYNIACGGCPNGCSCTVVEEALLPSPVASITQVKLNGAVMVTGSYRVDDNRLLVRTDGGRWPICQDLAKNDDQANTWSVTVKVGQEVPVIGQRAVGELACELINGCLGKPCRLPLNLATVTRQGLQINMIDLAELLKARRIGLFWSDMFLTTVNPYGLAGKPVVYDLDGPSFRRAGT